MAILILRQLFVMLFDIERDILDFVKLLPASPITPLDATVHLRVPRRIKEQLDLASPAGLLKRECKENCAKSWKQPGRSKTQ
jgi:hypothetical protein